MCIAHPLVLVVTLLKVKSKVRIGENEEVADDITRSRLFIYENVDVLDILHVE
jgi:hypothetical protein